MSDFKTFRRYTLLHLGACIIAAIVVVVRFVMGNPPSIIALLLLFLLSPSMRRIKFALGTEAEFERGYDYAMSSPEFMRSEGDSGDAVKAWSPVTQFVVFFFFALVSAVMLSVYFSSDGNLFVLVTALVLGAIAVFMIRTIFRGNRQNRATKSAPPRSGI
jgi:FtsH-binding integral membrane protein